MGQSKLLVIMRGSVVRGCRRKAGFLCDRLMIEKKKKKKRKETNREKTKKKTYLGSCVDIAIYCFSKNTTATARKKEKEN